MVDSARSQLSKRLKLTPVTAVFLIVLVDVLGFTIILPLLPFYAEHFGASPKVIGALLSSYAVCQLVSGPFLGRWSDKIGRKPLLLVSQGGTFLSFILLACAPNLTVVFLARMLDGLTAGNISLAQATISDHTAPKERGKAFSKIGVAFGVGFLIGPALSGYLAKFSFQAPIFAGAGLSALSILATMLLLPVKAKDPELADAPHKAKQTKIIDLGPLFAAFKRPDLATRLLQFFVFIMAFSLYTSGFALFASRRLSLHGHLFGPTEVAYVFAFGGLLGVLLQSFAMGRLILRFGEAQLVTIGFIGLSIGYAILSTASDLGAAMLAVSFSSLGHGVLRPTITSLISQSSGAKEQGTILGVNQSLQSLAQILAPLLGGFLIEANLTTAWALTAAAFPVVGLVIGRSFGTQGR